MAAEIFAWLGMLLRNSVGSGSRQGPLGGSFESLTDGHVFFPGGGALRPVEFKLNQMVLQSLNQQRRGLVVQFDPW
jgi:hypothetical protein